MSGSSFDPVDTINLEPDCSNCAALCCAVFAFDKSESFGIDKAAGEVCPNLSADNGCSIFSNRAERGFQGCVTYTCYGAGQRISQEVFGGLSWRGNPALMHRMGAALSVLRRIHEQIVLLRAARSLPLTSDQLAELETLELKLTPERAWTETSLAEFPIETVSLEVSTWLRQLRGLIS
ncbi:hypothetical protein [Labrenzia sp. PHM005]|uniref:hypothetical protein n=1 Tax=Labrenzia sp. PHM005 TaxID=2590016 RepID=UPI00113FDAF7|nr:hypothetical protein [Labrenzia sp. PHM005]QDG77678.1 hypothetical protein FJ695_18410 [Labrenzia sp. PHM005]